MIGQDAVKRLDGAGRVIREEQFMAPFDAEMLYKAGAVSLLTAERESVDLL